MATDTEAIEPTKNWLTEQGFYNVQKINSPVDFKASRDGQEYFIELKFTSSKKTYFGAATLVEWECALENPENFYFLFAHKQISVTRDDIWDFELMLAEELMKYSTIPPFKIFFSIPLPLKSSRSPPQRKSAKQATQENIRYLSDVFSKL